ncbi:hypothetical protein D1Y84_06970 [Acidipila sp. EB88]|nr:hypothetical protein D1Y84_06970 [Acidipila sp. EB88]
MAGVQKPVAAALAVAGLLVFAGCSVRVNKDNDGKEKDVSIHVPFGGVEVHKDNSRGTVDVGLPIYPGAMPEDDPDENHKSVDVRLGFGPWQMRVQTANYQSSDAQSKVQDFYTKSLSQYGDVLVCQGKVAVGKVHRTSAGLTCSDKNESEHTHVSSDSDLELKAGSERRQHIVAFRHAGGEGTHFALVALSLPTDSSSSDHMLSRDSSSNRDAEE